MCPGLLTYIPRDNYSQAHSLKDKNSQTFAKLSNNISDKVGTYKEASGHGAAVGVKEPWRESSHLESSPPHQTSGRKTRKRCRIYSRVSSGLLHQPTPDSAALQAARDLHVELTVHRLDQSDFHTSNDSSVLLYGHQFSQEQGKPQCRDAHTETLSPDELGSRVRLSTVGGERLGELVMAGREGEVTALLPTGEDEIVCQQSCGVVEISEAELVMALTVLQPRTQRKNKRMGCDRRHSDIRPFTCNMSHC